MQSVERAVRILKSFSSDAPERGVSELSRELGLHKSTVSRLMATLEREGLLMRDQDTERYRLGLDLVGLGAQVISFLDARNVARPLLRKFAEQCQETVNLVVLDGKDVVNLEQFVSASRRIRSFGRVGRRMPTHCTAAGKTLLAYLPLDLVMEILQEPLESFTEKTITDPAELLKTLESIRQNGFSTAEEELELGLNVVAAPVFDYRDEVVAAISVSGPSFRVTPTMFAVLGIQLIEVSTEISRQLGYRPHTS